MFLRDLHLAWRTLFLRSNRAYTLATILTFALGIGAATAIFSIAHAVLLAPLPYGGAERVVRITERNLSRGFPEFSVSTPNFLSWQERTRSFEALTAADGEGVNLGTDGRYERVQGGRASSTFWQVLGLPLIAGRAFTKAEDTLGAAPVAIVSEGTWRTRYGSDPGVVGRAIRVNGVDHTVVGIAPQDVGFSTEIAVWLPMRPDPEVYGRGDRRIEVFGRLAEGTTLAQAQSELDGISAALAVEFPDSNAGWDGAVQPIRDFIVGAQTRERLLLLLGAAIVLMLVACTNVANLQIARATARERELGVRQALGAARSRLAQTLVTENLVLAAGGAVLGVALAGAALRVAVAVLPAATPRLAAYALDWRAAAVAIGIVTLTAIVFGIGPALVAMRRQLAGVLQQLGRSSVDATRGPLRQVLVVVQFSLATILVVSAALLAQHLARLQDASLGFRPDRLLTARLTLPQQSENDDLAPHYAIHDRLLERVRAMPGVQSAGITSEIPLGSFNTSMNIAPDAGPPLTYEEESESASWRIVSPGYLETLGVPLLRGRGFAAQNESGRTIILSETLWKRLWPDGTDPVGRTIRLGNGQYRTVVGVVGDVRHIGLGEAPTPVMYMPTAWFLLETMTMLVRTEGDPAALVSSLRAVAEDVTPEHPLFDIQTMGSVVTGSVAEPRVQTMVLLAFAGSSLLLAAFGVAGVMAYLVTRRTPELAVRMALGATPRRLVADTIGRGGALCLAGVVLGASVVLGLSRAFAEFASNANVPAMLALGGSVLLAVGLMASWLPARRVARISPNLALRDA